MDAKRLSHRSSVEPDSRLLAELTLVQRGCLGAAALMALETLCAWWIPAVRHALPPWMIMKANTAATVLALAFSLACSESHRSQRVKFAARYLAALAIVISLGTLLEFAVHRSFGIDQLLAADSASPSPGRMSAETAAMFALLGVVALLVWRRRGVVSVFTDACVSLLAFAELILASGYLFGASRVFGLLHTDMTSPEPLLALMLLTFVAVGRRAEAGVFVILLGNGIGSKAARIACPLILVMPFLLEFARDQSLRAGLISPEYSAAIETSVAAMLALGLMLLLAWRIESLERSVRDLSLRDALTGLYNRRGLYLFAEQMLRNAQRSRTPVSILFIDLDDLKQINDSLGHETGSRFLCEMGELLKQSFRRTDVLGRVGGDEFVVVGPSTEDAMRVAANRLEQAAILRDAAPGRQYPLRFSFGNATTQPGKPESLEDLMARADHNMYETKRQRKLVRA